MSKKQMAPVDCPCCNVKREIAISKPSVAQATIARLDCQNCEGSFLFQVKKPPRTPPTRVELFLKSIKMTAKTEKMYQLKRDEAEGKAKGNPYDRALK